MAHLQTKTSASRYETLSEFRYLLTRYLKRSFRAAKKAGIEPQQYTLLLHVAGLTNGQPSTISVIAKRLESSHNATVELVDRAVQKGLVKKTKTPDDARKSIIHLTPKGKRRLELIARAGITELKTNGPELASALIKIITQVGGVNQK